MSDILIQYVTIQRTVPPTGTRVLQDGTLQHTTTDNPLPTETEALEKDRSLTWQTIRTLSSEDLAAIKVAVAQSGFLELPPRILINYCKEDPGTQIWTVALPEASARVVLYDPRPRRSPEIDSLLSALAPLLA